VLQKAIFNEFYLVGDNNQGLRPQKEIVAKVREFKIDFANVLVCLAKENSLKGNFSQKRLKEVRK